MIVGGTDPNTNSVTADTQDDSSVDPDNILAVNPLQTYATDLGTRVTRKFDNMSRKNIVSRLFANMKQDHRQIMFEAYQRHRQRMDDAAEEHNWNTFNRLQETLATQADVIQAQASESQDTRKELLEDMRVQYEDFRAAFSHLANTVQSVGTIVTTMHTDMQTFRTQVATINTPASAYQRYQTRPEEPTPREVKQVETTDHPVVVEAPQVEVTMDHPAVEVEPQVEAVFSRAAEVPLREDTLDLGATIGPKDQLVVVEVDHLEVEAVVAHPPGGGGPGGPDITPQERARIDIGGAAAPAIGIPNTFANRMTPTQVFDQVLEDVMSIPLDSTLYRDLVQQGISTMLDLFTLDLTQFFSLPRLKMFQ
jgi:hypothetical protein